MTIINKVLLLQAIKGFQREKVSSNSRCRANKKVNGHPAGTAGTGVLEQAEKVSNVM